ncbi:MAG: hypothetical protein JXR96_22740 [Deltaproteobacteria bacterium]|nr:hypothetical protein [Deltaproteobacteria bacterium]
MARYDELVLDRLEKLVEAVEEKSTAELVVVLAHRADPYRDVPYRAGCLLMLVVLLAMVYAPVDFSAQFLALDLLGAFLLGWLAGRSGWAVRLLTLAGRRRRAVAAAARCAFTERGVSLTRERTGLLLFISWLERRVELLWDVGIENEVPLPEWNAALKALRSAPVFESFPDSLVPAIEPLRALLDAHLPCGEDNPDEIPNRPVVQ